jgi:ADP-heptose:LPS heptosyltransferase
MTESDPSSLRHVGVFHAGALGDCILTLHGLRTLLSPPAHARVTLIARSPVAAFAAGRSLVTDAADLDRHGFHTLFSLETDVPPDVKRLVHSFDLILSFCGDPSTVLPQRLRQLARSSVAAIDPKPRVETTANRQHITTQWLADLRRQLPPALAAATPAKAAPTPLLRLTDADRASGEQRWIALAPHDGPRVLIHPGSGGAPKCWPIERFEALALAALAEGWRPLWLLGPAELERYGPALSDRLRRTAPVACESDIAAAAVLVGRADAYVGNDSGISHLAAALGIPAIAIFGPTDPAVWRPLGPIVFALRTEFEATQAEAASRPAALLAVLRRLRPATP